MECNLNQSDINMRKVTKVLAQIIYFIIAFSPIFFLGYLLGLQLLK